MAQVNAGYCATCGSQRPVGAAECPTCGASFAPVAPSRTPRARRSGNHPLTIVILVALVIGGIYLLNNTRVGLELKCRYLNDLGACLEVVLITPATGSQGLSPLETRTPEPTEDPAAAAQRAEQERILQAQAAIDRDVETVASDLDAVTRLSLESEVAAVPTDLTSQAKDVATTLHDQRVVLAEAKNGTDGPTVCSDAYTVASDAYTVGSDEYTVESDGYTIDGSVGEAKNAVTTLQSDFAQLQSDQTRLPDYSPTSLPTETQIAKAVSSATTMIANAQKTYAGYLAKAKKAVKTATGYADEAQRVCDNTP